MRAVDEVIEAMPGVLGAVLRSMAVGRNLDAPNWHHIGEPPRPADGLAQLEREAMQQFAHRLGRAGVNQ